MLLKIAAQVSNREICDSQIMRQLTSSECNDYTGFERIHENCSSTCTGVSSKAKIETCCEWKCFFSNHTMVVDGKFNKTALAAIYGEAGDPKIIESIGECEDIGNLDSSLRSRFYNVSNFQLQKIHSMKCHVKFQGTFSKQYFALHGWS